MSKELLLHEMRILVDFFCKNIAQWARKFKKVQAKKKIVKSNKSISRNNFFDQIPFFAISKMTPAKNQFLNWEKV